MNMTIDLRSDTVTKPTAAMQEAMFKAPLGDDVFAEDPSVNLLEQKVADLFGKEAAIFCPSGTMTNQIAIKIHTQPGDELICDAAAHIYNFEAGGIAFNSLVQPKLLNGDQGRLHLSLIENAINPPFDWFPQTRLVALENTVNRAGGSVYKRKDLEEISSFCFKNNIPIHLDGARIFNALAVSDYSALEIGKWFDTVSVCFSKGLGAPVGSALLGTKEMIKKARRIRKILGGGMRQAGILASAAVFALENHIERLILDHVKAAEIDTELKKCSYVKSILPVETNIIIFALNDDIEGKHFVNSAKNKGILCTSFGKNNIRMVTHLDYTDEMHHHVLNTLKQII